MSILIGYVLFLALFSAIPVGFYLSLKAIKLV